MHEVEVPYLVHLSIYLPLLLSIYIYLSVIGTQLDNLLHVKQLHASCPRLASFFGWVQTHDRVPIGRRGRRQYTYVLIMYMCTYECMYVCVNVCVYVQVGREVNR